MGRLYEQSKTFTQLLFLLLITVFLSTTTLATTQDDLLEEMMHTIEDIKTALDRCEEEVCRQVRLNADKRHEGVKNAQENPREASHQVEEIRAIIQEDLITLDRCERDSCQAIISLEQQLLQLTNDYLDLDSDGDGVLDVVERGDLVTIAGFESFSVYKQSTNGLVEYTVVASRGSGAGRASLQSFTRAACPQERCEKTITIEVENTPPVIATISPDIFGDYETHLAIDGSGNIEFVSKSVCSQREQEIHCLDSEGSVVFSFERGTDVSCTSRADDLWCWGKNERGAETQVVFTFEETELRAAPPNLNATECHDPPCPGYPYNSVAGPQENDSSNAQRDPNYLDPDDDGDGVLTVQERTRGPVHRDIAARNSQSWSAQERREVQEHLRNQTNLTGSDFGLAMAYAMSGNEWVREVRYDNNTGRVHVEQEQRVRLLGFIPMRARTTTVISEDGLVQEQRPWWTALARADTTGPIRWMQPESIRAMVNGDFEYCPDGTMVQSLADCPAHQDAVESAQIGVCQDGEILCPDGTCQPFGAGMGDACEGHANEDVLMASDNNQTTQSNDHVVRKKPGGAVGDEVDILGMQDEKVAAQKGNTSGANTGRNPQTGKQVQ